MDNVNNENDILTHLINDTVTKSEPFANIVTFKFRYHTPQVWMIRQAACQNRDLVHNARRIMWRVMFNVFGDSLRIVGRCL